MSRKAQMRKKQASSQNKTGSMIGMRGGIKKAAHSAGIGDEKKVKSSWVNNTITTILVIVIAYFIIKNFG